MNHTKKYIHLLSMLACAFLMLGSPISAKEQSFSSPTWGVEDYFAKTPWIGLIANEITYGPITISKVKICDDGKLAIVKPGKILNGTLKYKIKAEDLDFFHLYHLVIGIEGEGGQDCVSHSMGIFDEKGDGSFTLTAPDKIGVYEVRFSLAQGFTCSGACDKWNSGEQVPSAAATIGIIIVK